MYTCVCDQIKDLENELKNEKSNRSDLEMYVAVMAKQKDVFHADVDAIRKELGECKRSLFHHLSLCCEIVLVKCAESGYVGAELFAYALCLSVHVLAALALLDKEKKEHNNLKITWQMANDQFLEAQRLLMIDMKRLESVLTEEQQRRVAGTYSGGLGSRQLFIL